MKQQHSGAFTASRCAVLCSFPGRGKLQQQEGESESGWGGGVSGRRMQERKSWGSLRGGDPMLGQLRNCSRSLG